MEKKNTILLIVIAIATLLVAVVGATFAYFATTINVNEGFVNVTARTDTASSVFLATGEELGLTISADNMKNAEIGNNVSATKNLVITYGSSKDNYKTTCTYDIEFFWTEDSEAKYLPGTATPPTANPTNLNGGKEFTIALGDAIVDPDNTGFTETDLTTTGMEETNISAYNSTKTGTCSDPSATDELACQTKVGDGWTPGAMTLKTGAKISAKTVFNATAHCSDGSDKTVDECSGDGVTWIAAGGGVKVTWPVTITFYNLPLNQNALAGHTYNGHVQVAHVVCE